MLEDLSKSSQQEIFSVHQKVAVDINLVFTAYYIFDRKCVHDCSYVNLYSDQCFAQVQTI